LNIGRNTMTYLYISELLPIY